MIGFTAVICVEFILSLNHAAFGRADCNISIEGTGWNMGMTLDV
ncbi:hypothetical protein [Sphingobium sp. Z007]|nr:hypothetical protein [Sphingobium sp. Z007]